MTCVARFDLKCLLSACIHLSRRGGHIIRQEQQRGQLCAHNKKFLGDERDVAAMEGNEVLTVADGRSQDAIVTSLRKMFPGLRIVGEEGEVPGTETATALEDVPPFIHAFEVPSELNASMTATDTCLWIDPLDGTKEFVLNNLDNVSVLIGICVRDRPVAGVMLEPFLGGEPGIVTYGAVGVGVFGDRIPAVGECPQDLVVVTNPKSAGNPRIMAALDLLDPKPKIVIANASGKKLLRVIRGEASVFLIGPGPSRWDSCAGEALLMAVGGMVTDLEGRVYTYVEGGTYDNSAGLIAARTREVHAKLVEALAVAARESSSEGLGDVGGVSDVQEP